MHRHFVPVCGITSDNGSTDAHCTIHWSLVQFKGKNSGDHAKRLLDQVRGPVWVSIVRSNQLQVPTEPNCGGFDSNRATLHSY